MRGTPKWTPGPWRWWTSNSWWRLKSADRDATPVLTPVTVAADGHPNLEVSAADAALIAAAPDLAEVLRAYEDWEADLIRKNASWSPNGEAETPRLTQAQWARLLEIQAMRNAALAKAEDAAR